MWTPWTILIRVTIGMNKSMANTVFIGHVQSACCNFKTLVVAENPEEAKAKIMKKFGAEVDGSRSEVCISVRPFGTP